MKASRARGFRRLTLAVSLVLLCAGLVTTAKDAYQTGRYVMAQERLWSCEKEASSWSPSNEELERRFKAPPGAKPSLLDNLERNYQWTEEVRDQKRQECRDAAESIRLPRRVDAAFTGLVDLLSMNPSLGWLMDLVIAAAGHLVGLAVALGVLLSVSLAAIPWVLFLSVRWIARGFAGNEPKGG